MEIKLGITLIFLSWAFTNIIFRLLSSHEQYLLATSHISHNDYPMIASIIISLLFVIGVGGVASLLVGIWKL